MPVYLLTFHAHGTWMPDKPKGYVRRGKGIQPTDPAMAMHYRARQQHPIISFDRSIQQALIAITQQACECQLLRLHGIATDTSHIHILISWSDRSKPIARIRQNLKQSLTRQLNERIRRAQWFSRGGSQKRVSDREHYDYLMNTYLPSHRGLGWFEGQG